MSIATFHHSRFPPERLAGLKHGRRVSVCIPARDEAGTLGPILSCVQSELVSGAGLVDEVVVVDDGSRDATAQVAEAAGARVVTTGSEGLGKGQALWRAVAESSGDLVVFCDADVANFGPHFVTGLLGPLLEAGEVALVKGFYQRPLDGAGRGGGRVTELVARPLIATLFPHLGGVIQPLAGETAATRQVLEQVAFAHGYGVELGLLIDVSTRWGTGSLAQVDLGVRVHRNRPLEELSVQALAVMQVALAKAGAASGPAVLDRPGLPPVVVTPGECPPLGEAPGYRQPPR